MAVRYYTYCVYCACEANGDDPPTVAKIRFCCFVAKNPSEEYMLHKNLETNLSANQRRRKTKDCITCLFYKRSQTKLNPFWHTMIELPPSWTLLRTYLQRFSYSFDAFLNHIDGKHLKNFTLYKDNLIRLLSWSLCT